MDMTRITKGTRTLTEGNGERPTGLRALKRQRVRADLIQAALQLFGAKGFDATTIEDVVAAAGVSRRTFFRYFGSKEDVAFDWMREQGEYMLAVLMERPTKEDPFKSITHIFLKLAEYHDANPKRARFLTSLIFDNHSLSSRFHDEYTKWEDRYVHVLEHRSRGALARETFAIRLEVATTISAFVVANRTWMKERRRGPLRDKVAAAFAILGMPTPK